MPTKAGAPAVRGSAAACAKQRRRATSGAVADDALAFVYEVALATVAELMDATAAGAAGARDVWVLALSSVPMLNRALRGACPLDAAVAATLAYERMRMFGDGGRRGLPRALKGDPLWYMWGVPPVLDLSAARSADPPPFAIALREAPDAEDALTPSAVRARRLAAVRAIERGLRAEGCARRGWHRCADLPHVHAKVSTYVVWMRSLALAIDRLSRASAACVSRVCEHPRCCRALVARRSNESPSELARRATAQTLADLASRVDAGVRDYWACALATHADAAAMRLFAVDEGRAGLPAHGRFCSPSCREGWVDDLWSSLPMRPGDLHAPAAAPEGRPDSATRIDGELAAATARNCAVAKRMGGDDAWRTSAWWARPGAGAPAELTPACIAATAALVQALNVDLALLAGASTVAGTRLPFGTRRLLPGGSADWRGAGAFWRPMLVALVKTHEAATEPVPVGQGLHFEHSAFVRRARAGTLALFDRQFGAAARPRVAPWGSCATHAPFGGCDCGCAPKTVSRAGAHRGLSA